MTDQTTPNHTEAPASFTIKFFLGGFDTMLTLRGCTFSELQPEIDGAMEWLKASEAVPTIHNRPQGNGSAPQAQAAPAPAAAPQAARQPQAAAPASAPAAAQPQARGNGGPTETMPVISLAHAVTESGNHFLKVKTAGKYSKFGVKAWEESIPVADWQAWPIGQEFIPPAEMHLAVIQDGKKVIQFQAQPGATGGNDWPEEPPF